MQTLTMATKPAAAATGPDTTAEGTRINWDDSKMESVYANVCNISSTREEVVLLFGVNQAWNRGQTDGPWAGLLEELPALTAAARRWSAQLANLPDLAGSVMRFYASRVE